MIGAILAGGGSRRFGGRPKADIKLADGRSMIETVAEVVRVVTGEIVVLGRANGLPGVPRLEDRRPGEGPLAGLETLLHESDEDDVFLVCPCDMPALTEALLTRLAAPTSATFSAFQVPGESGPRSLPLRLTGQARPLVANALDEGRRSVRVLLAASSVCLVDVAAGEIAALENVNDDSDLARVNAHANPRRS